MKSNTESSDLISTLQIFCNTNTHLSNSPPRSGTLTPPFYSSAAVPFRWEELPGKPREPTTITTTTPSTPSDTQMDITPKCLELPPRLLALDYPNVSKLNSPTTVLDGPYIGKTRFQTSSFRIIRKECYGSFRRSFSPEKEEEMSSALVVSGRKGRDKGLLGSSWRWGRGKREIVGGHSYVFPNSSIDKELQDEDEDEDKDEEDMSCKSDVKITRVRQSGSVSSYTRSRFWASIYGSLKQVVPWKSRKQKKDGFII
ncbi:hypothetical protein M5689_004527 [Euphorbia peplus]|nr:hypothetical protein M5689_004527 [Euphorbia peplus]